MPRSDPAVSGPVGKSLRTDADRMAEHRAIEELATRLLPALIARLVASTLAEIEVREDDSKIRLRRPVDGSGPRPASDRQFRIATGGGHGAGRDRDGRGGDGTRPAHDVAPPAHDALEPGGEPSEVRSPAVGIFRPRPGISGSAVRTGDRLGVVDMLGIAQEVSAPLDGVVAALLAEAGDGVEYGQPLVRMAPPVPGEGTADDQATDDQATDDQATDDPAAAVVAAERA